MTKGIGGRTLSAVPPDSGIPPYTVGLSPSHALGRALADLRRSKLTDQSAHRMTELLVRFTIFLDKGLRLRDIEQITAEHVRHFIVASISKPSGPERPSVATMHLRRSALRLYFRTLRQSGVEIGDPTQDLVLPPRSCLAVRPLTDDEIVVCRSFSLQTLTATLQPATWALAEATARTSEIPTYGSPTRPWEPAGLDSRQLQGGGPVGGVEGVGCCSARPARGAPDEGSRG